MLIDRIKAIAKSKNMSLKKFSESIGFNYTTLNGYSTGNRKTIDSTLLEKIASTYVDINCSWLLTGMGDMYIDKIAEAGKLVVPAPKDMLAAQGKATVSIQDIPLGATPRISVSTERKRGFVDVKAVSLPNDTLYNMYKEEKAENKVLIEDIGALKQQVRDLTAKLSALSMKQPAVKRRVSKPGKNHSGIVDSDIARYDGGWEEVK